jgi:hypothetical protein
VQGKIHFILFSAFFITLFGCSSEPGVTVKHFDFNESFTPASWQTIAVLPFSGDKKFRRTSPEWFSFYLQKQQRYTIVTPTYAEIEVIKKGMAVPENGFSLEEARHAGRLLNADAVFVGSIEAKKVSQSPIKLSLQLIDVETGKKIATHHIGYPSWVLLWDNFQEYVRLATEAAGRDFLVVLKGLSEGKQVAPASSNASLDKSSNDI